MRILERVAHKNLSVPGRLAHSMHKRRANGQGEVPSNPNGRNKRSVWTIPVARCKEAHFAIYPEKLIETPIQAGCPKGGIVLDPFCGSGTTAIVCERLGRSFMGIEINPAYVEIAKAEDTGGAAFFRAAQRRTVCQVERTGTTTTMP